MKVIGLLDTTKKLDFKMNKGGLKNRKVEPKEVDMYSIDSEERLSSASNNTLFESLAQESYL